MLRARAHARSVRVAGRLRLQRYGAFRDNLRHCGIVRTGRSSDTVFPFGGDSTNRLPFTYRSTGRLNRSLRDTGGTLRVSASRTCITSRSTNGRCANGGVGETGFSFGIPAYGRLRALQTAVRGRVERTSHIASEGTMIANRTLCAFCGDNERSTDERDDPALCRSCQSGGWTRPPSAVVSRDLVFAPCAGDTPWGVDHAGCIGSYPATRGYLRAGLTGSCACDCHKSACDEPECTYPDHIPPVGTRDA